MKNYFTEICTALTVFLGGLTVWRNIQKDVPESTKEFIREEIKLHEEKEDKERKERAVDYQEKLSLRLSNDIREVTKTSIDEYKKERAETDKLKEDLLKKDVRFLSSQFKDLHEDVKKFTENCEFHKGKRK